MKVFCSVVCHEAPIAGGMRSMGRGRRGTGVGCPNCRRFRGASYLVAPRAGAWLGLASRVLYCQRDVQIIVNIVACLAWQAFLVLTVIPPSFASSVLPAGCPSCRGFQDTSCLTNIFSSGRISSRPCHRWSEQIVAGFTECLAW